tara:strand:- start:105 stop:992 length:888 start_codon:yes stop_codon:yes gene_type:complete
LIEYTTKNIDSLIDSFGVEIPSVDEFQKLNSFFPIYNDESDTIVNFERGMLLYGMIGKFKPKIILEIGTASGYSTICMAKALTEFQIQGKIITIDPEPHNKKNEYILNLDNNGPKSYEMTRDELWKRCAKTEWIEKIQVITGHSGEVLEKNDIPKIDMAFIDGHHVFNAVKHDFYATLKNSSDRFQILFDDYFPEENKDVKQLVDEEISPYFPITLIKTNYKEQISKMHGITGELFMCLIDSNDLKKPISEIYSEEKINSFLKEYNKWELRWRRRKELNSKIPFLEKIRFRKFFN